MTMHFLLRLLKILKKFQDIRYIYVQKCSPDDIWHFTDKIIAKYVVFLEQRFYFWDCRYFHHFIFFYFEMRSQLNTDPFKLSQFYEWESEFSFIYSFIFTGGIILSLGNRDQKNLILRWITENLFSAFLFEDLAFI